nr:hypothetical protein BaRGS_001281 [Batillaria attramentaria]
MGDENDCMEGMESGHYTAIGKHDQKVLLSKPRLSPREIRVRLTENVTYTVSLGPPTDDMSALGDHLKDMNGQRFSTYDNDNDNSTTRNCAMEYGAGWWFNACAEANFNGRMSDTGVRENVLDEMFWEGLDIIPKAVAMWLRNGN